MDPDVIALARSASTTLVTLMVTDVWQGTREGIIRLWQRMQPQRAEVVALELETSREDALAARETQDEETLSELRMQWQGRLRRLLAAQPEAADELRRLLAELAPDAATVTQEVTQRATASGNARIYQAGRDQHITER